MKLLLPELTPESRYILWSIILQVLGMVATLRECAPENNWNAANKTTIKIKIEEEDLAYSKEFLELAAKKYSLKLLPGQTEVFAQAIFLGLQFLPTSYGASLVPTGRGIHASGDGGHDTRTQLDI